MNLHFIIPVFLDIRIIFWKIQIIPFGNYI